MKNSIMQNTAIGLLIMTALILLLVQKSGDKLKLTSFIALGLLLLVCFLSPLIGFIFAVPVFVVVYFDHYKEVLAYWDKMKTLNFNLGGKE